MSDLTTPDEVSDRFAAFLEIVALCLFSTAGYLIPSEWRWAVGTLITGTCFFVLGYFGLARR